MFDMDCTLFSIIISVLYNNSMHCCRSFLRTLILSHVDVEKPQHVILDKMPGQIIKKQHGHLALVWNYNQVLFSFPYLSLLLEGKMAHLCSCDFDHLTPTSLLHRSLPQSHPHHFPPLSLPTGRARSSRKPRCQRLSWQAGAVNPLLWLVQL